MKTLIKIPFIILALVFSVAGSYAKGLKNSFVDAAVLKQVIDEMQEKGVDVDSLLREMKEQNMDLQTLIHSTNSSMILMSDPAYEWSQFKNKSGKVELTEMGLSMESKTDKEAIVSQAEFSFSPEDNPFNFGLYFLNTKAEEKTSVGIIFDFQNNNNYKAFIVNKKEFVYYVVEKGESSIIKQGLVKPGKFIESLDFKRQGSKIDVLLNGVEVTTLTRITLENPVMGVIISGKMKANVIGFHFDVPISETDGYQSSGI